MSKKVRNFAITILAISLIIGGIGFIDKSKNNVNTADNSLILNRAAGLPMGASNEIENPSDEFSIILASIKGLEIDTSIFEDPTFKALRDYPIFLGTDVVGRINPFAPIGSDTELIFAGIEFQTIQPIEITASSATLGAQINVPGNDTLKALFEYGLTDTFGTSTGPVPFTKNGTALFSISELTPNKKYCVRAILTNGSDTIVGNTMTFTTKAK